MEHSLPYADSPPRQPPHEAPGERAPRTNLLLSAAIEARNLKAAVRIRNLSATGALLQGSPLPNVGETLTLRRLDLTMDATVMWRTDLRCGVKFDAPISVAAWSSGTCSSVAGGGQPRVDIIQAAIRAGSPMPPLEERRANRSVVADERGSSLDRRLAEELALVRRLLENMGGELSDEPIIVHKHLAALQGFDFASQILGHIAAVLVADDRDSAVAAIGMEELRARLVRKPLFAKN